MCQLNRRRSFWSVCLLTAGFLWIGPLSANAGDGSWDVELIPYVWMVDIEGDATLRGRTGSVDTDFSDIMDNLEFGFMGRVEAWKDRWGLILDATHLNVGSQFDTRLSTVSANMDAEQTMIDAAVAYRALDHVLDNGNPMTGDVILGGRYQAIKAELDIVTNGPLSDLFPGGTYGPDAEWGEVFVGGRLHWGLTEKLGFAIRGDVGGFGLDSASDSDLTWNFLVGIDYQLKENISLKCGYRMAGIDYTSGEANQFGVDLDYSGAIVGLGFRL
jgi:opacity protein-like surface antigen